MAALATLISGMTLAKELGLGSAASGTLGTLFLYFGTFGLQHVPLMASTTREDRMRIDARNRRRLILQRVGLAFLLISFVLAGATELLR